MNLRSYKKIVFILVAGLSLKTFAAPTACEALGGGTDNQTQKCVLGNLHYQVTYIAQYLETREPQDTIGFNRVGQHLLNIKYNDILKCQTNFLTPISGGFEGDSNQITKYKNCLDTNTYNLLTKYPNEVGLCHSLKNVANPNLSFYRGAIVTESSTSVDGVPFDDSFPVCSFEETHTFGLGGIVDETEFFALQNCKRIHGDDYQNVPLKRMPIFMKCLDEQKNSL